MASSINSAKNNKDLQLQLFEYSKGNIFDFIYKYFSLPQIKGTFVSNSSLLLNRCLY